MSKVNIQGKEFSILKIFSDDFFFKVPLYQRPYAWTTEHAGELFEDLLTFIGDKELVEELNPYFLGSIVLIKGDESEAQIIDGQQRLTTLTILLSAIRALVGLTYADSVTTYLAQKGDPIAGTADRYRLMIRERDSDFFQQYIQDKGGIEKLQALDPTSLSDSKKNIRNNALLFLRRLQTVSEDQRFRLVRAIVNRCYLVVVSTPNFDSAYRIFSVLNDRGLNLSHADILKADIIGKIPTEQEQAKYSKEWEDTEELLGRDTFQNLFAHMRMIYHRAKLQGTVLGEFRDYVWPTRDPQQEMEPKKFIDTVLIPYAEAYSTIRSLNYESVKLAEKVNGLFKWLNRIDNSDWIPPAILYYSRYHNDPDSMVRFFTDLERLAAGLMVLRANVNKRIERYSRLLDAIDNHHDLYLSSSPLQLNDSEQNEILTLLDGNLYEYWFCKYVLLRLDESLADAGATYAYSSISVEHVLPQNPASGSMWMTWFPNKEDREKYVHRLGNLVLLSQKKNSQAQRFDFIQKKTKYFSTSLGVVPFAITSQVVNEQAWTPFVIEKHQAEMISVLKRVWRLN